MHQVCVPNEYIESDVKEAYTNLRELTKDVAPPVEKRAEIEAQTNILYQFVKQDSRSGLKLALHAETALAEGHVELFEKVCDWIQLDSVTHENEMANSPWLTIVLARSVFRNRLPQRL